MVGKSKPQHRIRPFPNLVFSDEAFRNGVQSTKMCGVAKRKMFELLSAVNEHGTNKDYLGKSVEHTGRSKLIELKFKGSSKSEWRFLFKRLETGEYAFMHFFLKKDEKIRKQDFAAAVRIAKREGW